jgi:hypothetical protein
MQEGEANGKLKSYMVRHRERRDIESVRNLQ